MEGVKLFFFVVFYGALIVLLIRLIVVACKAQSSMARGIAGAALFGVSGAVIGSTPKSKVKHEAIGYAVIGYRDAKGEDKVIILKDQTPNSFICRKLVSALTSCVHTRIEKVNL